ncbi:hypothetical protein MAR_028818, partial [Mya arenaria]
MARGERFVTTISRCRTGMSPADSWDLRPCLKCLVGVTLVQEQVRYFTMTFTVGEQKIALTNATEHMTRRRLTVSTRRISESDVRPQQSRQPKASR